MKIEQTAVPGVLLLTPRIFGDSRGAFWETWNQRAMEEAGLAGPWVQDNSSRSQKNVLRGIHYQVIQPQGKLVRAAHGAILDVAVDLRRSSPYFGRHVAVELNDESGAMLWIPIGFGHAFLALTEGATVNYKATDYYAPAGERSILWNDPDLAIPWPIESQEVIQSDKDAHAKTLRDADLFD
jgi:dTDP-4-dehydrorhamnose 3,5-epimerase